MKNKVYNKKISQNKFRLAPNLFIETIVYQELPSKFKWTNHELCMEDGSGNSAIIRLGIYQISPTSLRRLANQLQKFYKENLIDI